MKTRGFPRSKLAQWHRSAFEALTSDVVAGRVSGPAAPPEWASTLHQLTDVIDGKLAPLMDALSAHYESERLQQELAEA